MIETAGVLLHAGVKGMKWGVRKKEKTSDLQKSDNRKAKIKKTAIVGGAVVAAALVAYGTYQLGKNNGANYHKTINLGKDLVNQVTRADIASRKNRKVRKDSIIPAHSVFSTLSNKPTLDRSQSFYATLSGRDKEVYRRKFTEELLMRDWSDTKVHSNGTVSQKPLRVAGLDTAQKLYRQFSGDSRASIDHWHRNRAWSAATAGGRNDAFLDFLKSKGYDAMVDYLDVGYGGKETNKGAMKPLIVFGGSEYLVDVGSHLVREILRNN